MLRTTPVPRWLENGAEYGEQGPGLELDSCLVELAKLRLKFKNWKMSGASSSMGSIEDLIEISKILDRRLIPDWLPWLSNAPESSIAYGSTIHTYSSIAQAVLCNRYRAARVIINAILAATITPRLPQAQPFDSSAEQVQAVSRVNIRALVDEICATVPYHFGRVGNSPEQLMRPAFSDDQQAEIYGEISAPDAFVLMWPLLIAAEVERNTPKPSALDPASACPHK